MTFRLNLGLRVHLAQDQVSDGKRDHTLCYKAWAYSLVALGYNSPPLIRAWLPGMNQGHPDQH